MAILNDHIQYYNETIFTRGFFQDPVLSFGYQGIEPGIRLTRAESKDTWHPENLEQLCAQLGYSCISLDLFDPRAKLRFDMNLPVPASEHEKYGTIVDIGTTEHLFDTRQCVENLMRMLKVGGKLMVVLPVKGYYGHGLHTFHPGAILGMFTKNGFRIAYHKFSTWRGKPVTDPENEDGGVLIWVVGIKEKRLESFVSPQQDEFDKVYANATTALPLGAM